jgi:hypothetical protein
MPIPAVSIPAAILAAPFPTNADRTAGTFNAKAVDWANSENAMATRTREIAEAARLNALTANTAATEANASVGDAAAQVTLAGTQVTLATDQATIAVGAVATSGAVLWVSGATYAVGNLVYSPLSFQHYRRRTAGAGAVDPSLDPLNWEPTAPPPTLARSARTNNAALAVTDTGRLIDITSGTFTQTFVAAATLGSGWFCYIRNSGTGDITLDPNASELIDGLTSYVMYPGEVRLVQCDGVALRTLVLNSFYRVFAASGTFNKPPGYIGFQGFLWGGGGGGGKSAGILSSGGGGGGACFPFNALPSMLGASESVTIGAGGSGVGTMLPGSVGGTSSIGSLVYAYGGGGGGGFGSNTTGGGGGGGLSAGATGIESSQPRGGGNPGGGDPASSASTGQGLGGAASGKSSAYGGAGGGVRTYDVAGASLYGGGGGGAGDALPAGGGLSTYGGSGGAGANSTSGLPGLAPGGGGGGTRSGSTSGAGARGELRIWGQI